MKIRSEEFKNGLIEGVRRFAWMKDGITYVGTCGFTLKEALEEIDKEYPDKKCASIWKRKYPQ